jgi:arylsulfatase A-like enzyme
MTDPNPRGAVHRRSHPPNLVFVFPDEMRQQATGCMRADPVITPNLDRLAREGLVLTHAVSNTPVCSPYRAMLLTGRWPHATGVLSNVRGPTVPYGNYLKPHERCISDVLHDAGYRCGYIGKYHLDPPDPSQDGYAEGPRRSGHRWDAWTPPGERRHGFDFWHSYGCCDRHMDPHYWTTDATLEEPIHPRQWSSQHETDVAVSYIRNEDGQQRDPSQPFCLFVSYNPPHMPFHQVPERYVEMYGDAGAPDLLNRPNVKLEGEGEQAARHAKNYFASVTGVDDQFGRILAALDDAGLADDTIVVFSSDHGEMMGSHGRMHKGVWYDESLLIPFIIRWPGRIAAGERDDLLLSVPDTMPTLLSMMGLGDRIPPAVQGRDLSGALLGRTDTHRPTAAPYIMAPPEAPADGMRGLRTHRYTLTAERTPQGVAYQLFDSREDPYQMHDVASEQPDVVSELAGEMRAALVGAGDPWAMA